jgi:hypothetical protein
MSVLKQITIEDHVRFTYKGGRKVYGKVVFIDSKIVVLKLLSDYIGKNVEWFVGEEKQFFLKECKKIRLATQIITT